MHPKHPLPCSQVSANGFCTQWTEFITHLQTLFIKDLFWDYIPFWKTEGRTEVMKSRGRRGKQLLDDLKETTGYWTLKEDTLVLTLWKRLWTCRQTDYGMNERINEFPSTTGSSDISWAPRPPGILQASVYTEEHMSRVAEHSRARVWYQLTNPMITRYMLKTHSARSPYWQSILSHRFTYGTFRSLSQLATCNENKKKKKEVKFAL
jgi:hypothetical protein